MFERLKGPSNIRRTFLFDGGGWTGLDSPQMATPCLLVTGEGGEGGGEGLVALDGGVLINECGSRAGVAHPAHELLGAGPGGRRQGVAGVAEIMKPKADQANGGTGRLPGPAVEVAAAQEVPVWSGEHQGLCLGSDVMLEVTSDGAQNVGRNGDGARASGRLGRPQDLAAIGQFLQLTANPHRSLEVDIGPGQAAQLPVAQPAPAARKTMAR